MLSTISGARSSSEMSPSNPVNGHSFVIMMSHGLVFVTERRGNGRKPTHACCSGMVPRLFGTCSACSICCGAGSLVVAEW